MTRHFENMIADSNSASGFRFESGNEGADAVAAERKRISDWLLSEMETAKELPVGEMRAVAILTLKDTLRFVNAKPAAP